MSERKVLFLNAAHPVLEARLQALGFQCDHDYESPKEVIAQRIGEYTGIVIRSRFSLDATFLAKAERMKFIAREGVGIEHIDTTWAEAHGIRVLTSPEGSRDTVGEHTLGLLLALMNNLARADRQVRQGQWIREGNRGVEIKGKTVGILGYGNMGRAFAQRLLGFECDVIAYDKYRVLYGDYFARAVSLDTLFEQADILSIHIPYSRDNHHFIDDAFLSRFRKPIFLVNTARGGVLDTAALVRHLQAGTVRGAALDVLEYEEMSFEKLDLKHPPEPLAWLMQADNVVLSPHIAGWSFESKEGHARVLAEKIEALVRSLPDE